MFFEQTHYRPLKDERGGKGPLPKYIKETTHQKNSKRANTQSVRNQDFIRSPINEASSANDSKTKTYNEQAGDKKTLPSE